MNNTFVFIKILLIFYFSSGIFVLHHVHIAIYENTQQRVLFIVPFQIYRTCMVRVKFVYQFPIRAVTRSHLSPFLPWDVYCCIRTSSNQAKLITACVGWLIPPCVKANIIVQALSYPKFFFIVYLYIKLY